MNFASLLCSALLCCDEWLCCCRVEIDNEISKIGTFIQVDSVNTHGTLLALVQVITDLNLVVRKAYFTADGDWFMDGEHQN